MPLSQKLTIKPKNRQRQTAIVFIILFAVSVILIFIPFITGMDGMSGGFALSFIAIFLSIAFLIASAVFFVMAKKFDNAISDENIILHWVYEKSEWMKFTEKEFVVQKKEKRLLFILIIAISFIVLVIFSIVVRDSWRIMIIIFFGLSALLGFVAFMVPKLQYRNFKKTLPEAYLANGCAYLAGEFHCWSILGAALEDVEFDNKNMQIKITYSYPARYSRGQTTVRIPLPVQENSQSVLESSRLQAENAISILKKHNNL
jgi:predicted membrane channel-forming protein YqfA (hemolysin III family)